MDTIFDWITVAIFAGLIVLFLSRSMSSDRTSDAIWHYAPPALGCAAANYLGNHDEAVFGFALVAAVVVYTLYILRPFRDLSL